MPVLTSALGMKFFQRRVAFLDKKRAYKYQLLLPLMHTLAQIVGMYAVVLYGREGYDNILLGGSMASSSPAITFDKQVFVPY